MGKFGEVNFLIVQLLVVSDFIENINRYDNLLPTETPIKKLLENKLFKKNNPVLGKHWVRSVYHQRAGENPLKGSKSISVTF